MTLRVHGIIVVEDEGRNENTSISRTNFIYQLTQPLNFYKRGRQYEYFARIENVRIPIHFTISIAIMTTLAGQALPLVQSHSPLHMAITPLTN